jgi:Ornithine/acetylornithine aminotransferase
MEHVFPTYARFPFDLVEGKDIYLTDNNGKTYLDFTSGIGVCSFGYSNEIIQKMFKRNYKRFGTFLICMRAKFKTM